MFQMYKLKFFERQFPTENLSKKNVSQKVKKKSETGQLLTIRYKFHTDWLFKLKNIDFEKKIYTTCNSRVTYLQ